MKKTAANNRSARNTDDDTRKDNSNTNITSSSGDEIGEEEHWLAGTPPFNPDPAPNPNPNPIPNPNPNPTIQTTASSSEPSGGGGGGGDNGTYKQPGKQYQDTSVGGHPMDYRRGGDKSTLRIVIGATAMIAVSLAICIQLAVWIRRCVKIDNSSTSSEEDGEKTHHRGHHSQRGVNIHQMSHPMAGAEGAEQNSTIAYRSSQYI